MKKSTQDICKKQNQLVTKLERNVDQGRPIMGLVREFFELEAEKKKNLASKTRRTK